MCGEQGLESYNFSLYSALCVIHLCIGEYAVLRCFLFMLASCSPPSTWVFAAERAGPGF